MKTQRFTFSIPEPCSESWEQMTPCNSGKFCGSCRKTVVDFTSFSEAEITAFFADKAGKNVCGRFYADQIENKVFSYTAPAKRPVRTLAMVASVAALTVLSFMAEAQVKETIPVMSVVDSGKTQLTVEDTTDLLVIEGTVRDERNELIFNASVQLFEGDLSEGRKFEENRVIREAISDIDGNYRITIPYDLSTVKSDTVTISCQFVGYVREIVVFSLSAGVPQRLNLVLSRPKGSPKQPAIILGGITSFPAKPLLDRNNPGSKTIISAPQLEKMPR